jgi:hypothetical protein
MISKNEISDYFEALVNDQIRPQNHLTKSNLAYILHLACLLKIADVYKPPCWHWLHPEHMDQPKLWASKCAPHAKYTLCDGDKPAGYCFRCGGTIIVTDFPSGVYAAT